MVVLGSIQGCCALDSVFAESDCSDLMVLSAIGASAPHRPETAFEASIASDSGTVRPCRQRKIVPPSVIMASRLTARMVKIWLRVSIYFPFPRSISLSTFPSILSKVFSIRCTESSSLWIRVSCDSMRCSRPHNGEATIPIRVTIPTQIAITPPTVATCVFC